MADDVTLTHEKLVRDRIPEIIERDTGTAPHVRTVNDSERITWLLGTMAEEVAEFRLGTSTEELADMYEVIRALAGAIDVDVDEVHRVAAAKRLERGGFDKGLIWEAPGPATHGDAPMTQISIKAAMWREGGLLVVRKRDEWGGQWELPGGRLHVGEDPVMRVRRELLEELGFADADVHGVIASGYADPLAGFLPMFYEIFRVGRPPKAPVLSDEHVAWAAMRYEEVADRTADGTFNPALGRLLLRAWPSDQFPGAKQ